MGVHDNRVSFECVFCERESVFVSDGVSVFVYERREGEGEGEGDWREGEREIKSDKGKERNATGGI